MTIKKINEKTIHYFYPYLILLLLLILSPFIFSGCMMTQAEMERRAIEDFRKKPGIQIGNLTLRSNMGNFGSGKYYDISFIQETLGSCDSVDIIRWLKTEGGESNYEDILDQIQQSLSQDIGNIMIEQRDNLANNILVKNAAYYVRNKDDIIALGVRINRVKAEYAYHKRYKKLEFYSVTRGTEYKSLDGKNTFPKP